MPPHYELINHTADVGIRVWGATPQELFCHAAEGMFDILTDGWATAAKEARFPLTVEATDIHHLCVKWLQALLYEFDARRMVASSFRITAFSPTRLEAAVTYARFDPVQHQIKTELKAVTYHRLAVTRVAPQRWEVQVIFDV